MECNFHNHTIRWQMSKSTNNIFTFFIFAKVAYVRTIVTDRRTYIYTHTDPETDRPMAIGEILQICLNTNNLNLANVVIILFFICPICDL